MSSDTPPRLRVLVAEPISPVAATLRRHLESAGFEVTVAQYLDEAVGLLQRQPPALLIAASTSSFDGEQLCRRVRELMPALPVILLYPPEEEAADSRAHAVGASAALVGPIKRTTVATCVRQVLTIQALQYELAQAKDAQAQPISEPVLVPTEEEALALSGSGADFDFFKKLLLMEVKRSRRYRYPISILVVALDRVEAFAPEARNHAFAECLSLLVESVRDIDLAVPVSSGRYVVFLPHTGRDGAMVVGERLREVVKKLSGVDEAATASIGIASFEPSHKAKEISFGALMKDATDAVKRAQSEGGDRLVAPERAKRDRIAMT